MKSIFGALIAALLLAAQQVAAAPKLVSLTVDQVATTTPTLVQEYASDLFEAGRVEEAYNLVKALPDANLSAKQADLKATRVRYWGKHAAKAKEERALIAKTPEALQAEAAALAAMGKPSKWDAAFKVAVAGAIASPADSDAARECLARLKHLASTSTTKDYANSFLTQRLAALVGAEPAKPKEDRALTAKTLEALQTEAAAQSAMGKPSKWEAAFKVAAAGEIASGEDFDAARRCLTHFRYLTRTDRTTDYVNSFLNQRLQALVAAVPAKAEWLYDAGARWKELVWTKAQNGDPTYMDVLAAAANHGVMESSYASAIFLYGKARTVADFDAVTSQCRAILNSLGILGGDGPKRELALYAALMGMRCCLQQAALSTSANKEKRLEQAREWAQRVKGFGESAFLGEAEAALKR